jgi:GNAT superfamily N-acetyltransferase
VTLSPPFRIELLDEQERSKFDSGTPPLDAYLRTTASQDMRRGLATCFVAIHNESGVLAGYYTLSASTVALRDMPKGFNLGRYTSIPAALLGRLAVDQRFQKQGVGRMMIFNALRNTLSSAVAAAVFTVEAKNEKAATFYRHCGFEAFPTAAHYFFVPIQEIRRMFPGVRRLHLP